MEPVIEGGGFLLPGAGEGGEVAAGTVGGSECSTEQQQSELGLKRQANPSV